MIKKMELKKLLNSDNYKDRLIAAKNGYRLDILIDDDYNIVRETVYKYLLKNNYESVFDWANDNDVDIDIDEWLYSDNLRKRLEVAKFGYHLEILINDKNNNVNYIINKYLKEHNYESIFDWANDNNIKLDIDEWLNSDNLYKRLEVVKKGYYLDILSHDINVIIRVKVDEYLKEHNYKSVIDWAKDNNVEIDINEWVQGSYNQKIQVAKAGYKLDILILDENETIRNTAQNYLKDHNYKSIQDWIKENNSANIEQVDLSKTISNFIDNIENSSMLSVQTDLDSIDDFFNNDSAQLDIVTADTKIPIITITTLNKDEYKFQLNVTNNIIVSTFTTTDKFNKLLDLSISELNENSTFYKYVDDLNNCL